MDVIVKWVLARLREPSTWAGTGVIAMLVHTLVPGPVGEQLLAVLAAIGGLLGVILSEPPRS